MNASNRGRLLLATIMVLAFLSYLAIATSASRGTGGAIYEVEVSKLAYDELLSGSAPAPVERPSTPRQRR